MSSKPEISMTPQDWQQKYAPAKKYVNLGAALNTHTLDILQQALVDAYKGMLDEKATRVSEPWFHLLLGAVVGELLRREIPFANIARHLK